MLLFEVRSRNTLLTVGILLSNLACNTVWTTETSSPEQDRNLSPSPTLRF